MHETKILIVCNANMCRSPMAEWMLQTRLSEQHITADVSSAGVLFVGRPPTDKSAEVVSDRGGNIGRHRSRMIDDDLLRSSDIVLTMERNLVRKIWEVSPDLLERSFTLKGFIRVADGLGPRQANERLEDYIQRVHQQRDVAELASRSDVDDVKDPIGQNIRRYRSVADQLDGLLTTFIDLAWPPELEHSDPDAIAEPVSRRERSRTPHVRTSQADELLIVEIDDGGSNALTTEVCDGIDLALDDAQRTAQVVILAGRNGVFATSSDDPNDESAVGELLLRLHGFPLPVVAACPGTARGHGASLLLATDLRIGVTGSHAIGFDLLERGRPVDTLSIELARDRLRRTSLVPSVLLGTPWTPTEAIEAGFLDHLVEADELVSEVATKARGLAARLASGPFATTRGRLRTPLITYLHDVLAQSD